MSGTPDDRLGLSAPITRRDFVNGALVGSGAALLAGRGFAAASTGSLAPSGSPWTGYGGVGDYAWSNGNTEAVMNAAHRFRDRAYPDAAARPIDEEVDLLIVGGGFSGMTAAYEFHMAALPGRACLLLENHAIMGGEAKQNDFIVDGRRLTGPQGSNGGLLLKDGWAKGGFDGDTYDVYTDYYRELGLPTELRLEPLAGGAERYEIPNYHFAPMAPASERGYDTGYHFRGHGWVKNPSRDGFAKTPWPADVRKQMDDYVHNRRDVLAGKADAAKWLDTITYYDLLDQLGYGDTVRRYIDPYIAVANFGVAGNAISGYAAHRLGLPGTTIPKPPDSGLSQIGVISYPGGNAAILRMMLARIIPDAVPGAGTPASREGVPIDFKALDRPGAPIRIRLGATAIDVRHEGDPATAGYVVVTYAVGDTLRRVRAKSVVMASGGWVNRNIVSDMPDTHVGAYADFHYGPVLVANVAVRNWRFLDKLGIINARWFEGLGWHVTMRRNVASAGGKPLTPDDPTVLTFYIAIVDPGVDALAQGPVARQRMLDTSYGDYERQIRSLMTEMFSGAGLDARRDIAGIILNRWGHAFIAPQPGFFFGRNGAPAPSEVIRTPLGRIVFAHSELTGLMSAANAMKEAHRGAKQALAML